MKNLEANLNSYLIMDVYPSKKIMPFSVIINLGDNILIVNDISKNIKSEGNAVIDNQIIKPTDNSFFQTIASIINQNDFCEMTTTNTYFTDSILVHFQYYHQDQVKKCSRNFSYQDSEMECIAQIMSFLIKLGGDNAKKFQDLYPIDIEFPVVIENPHE